MSHFTVLVIGEDPEIQLAPYNEQPQVEPNGDKYVELEFEDCTDVVKEKWENETVECVQAHGAKNREPEHKRWVPRYSEAGRNAKSEPSAVLPVKQVYANIHDFAEKYLGYAVEGDLYGYYHNPNAKWDWYKLGGRWAGAMKLKDAPIMDAVAGEGGVFGNSAEPGYADQCRKADVDFEGMRMQAKAEAIKDYDRYSAATKGLEKYAISFADAKRVHEDIDQARDAYWSNPWVKAVKGEGFDSWGSDYHEQFFVGRGGRDAYIKHAMDSAFQTHAVVYEGSWYQRGEMGWFGISMDEMEDSDWDAQFTNLLSSLPDDTLLSVYDCHI
jgi:hypothetical protein